MLHAGQLHLSSEMVPRPRYTVLTYGDLEGAQFSQGLAPRYLRS